MTTPDLGLRTSAAWVTLPAVTVTGASTPSARMMPVPDGATPAKVPSSPVR
ncbi:MAG: hypothetical protein BWY76_02889 [bacterium ADurb.Bin429]|nr:MAG: hypothetical protein BWY76_02889 [bacterium ADurb.Bin429]